MIILSECRSADYGSSPHREQEKQHEEKDPDQNDDPDPFYPEFLTYRYT